MNKKSLYLFVLLLLSSYFLNAQKKNYYIENQIIKLIYRLDTLKGNVFYDSILNKIKLLKSDDSDLLYSLKIEKKIIDENHLRKININIDSLEKKIPSDIFLSTVKYTEKKVYLSNCTDNDSLFSIRTDSLSELINKSLQGNKEVYDSLQRIMYLCLNSVITKLSTLRCDKILVKRFVLLNVYEGSDFFIIIYGLYIDKKPHIELDSEIVYKNR